MRAFLGIFLALMGTIFCYGCWGEEAPPDTVAWAKSQAEQLMAQHANMEEGPDKIALGYAIAQLNKRIGEAENGMPWWKIVAIMAGNLVLQGIGFHRPIRKFVNPIFSNPTGGGP